MIIINNKKKKQREDTMVQGCQLQWELERFCLTQRRKLLSTYGPVLGDFSRDVGNLDFNMKSSNFQTLEINLKILRTFQGKQDPSAGCVWPSRCQFRIPGELQSASPTMWDISLYQMCQHHGKHQDVERIMTEDFSGRRPAVGGRNHLLGH